MQKYESQVIAGSGLNSEQCCYCLTRLLTSWLRTETLHVLLPVWMQTIHIPVSPFTLLLRVLVVTLVWIPWIPNKESEPRLSKTVIFIGMWNQEAKE